MFASLNESKYCADDPLLPKYINRLRNKVDRYTQIVGKSINFCFLFFASNASYVRLKIGFLGGKQKSGERW